MINHKLNRQNGFTIIELLISTVVFSMVLLLCATAVIQVGRIFYKGVTVNKVQDITRVVADDISQSIQFGSSADNDSFFQENSSGNLRWVCLGTIRYIYHTSIRLGYDGVKHGLWKDRPANCNDSIAPGMFREDTPTPGGKELIGKDMRVSNIDITDGNVWSIKVTISYGPSELFEDPDTRTQCLPRDRGGQFCAVSTITTNAIKRL